MNLLDKSMEPDSKLKSLDKYAPITGVITGILFIIIFAVIWYYSGEDTVDRIAGIVMGIGGLINLIIWLRTKNIGYLLFMSWQLLMSIRLLSALEEEIFVTIYRIIIAILLVVWLYFVFTKKIKWYYKKILELAAKPVEENANGFTARPFPVGSSNYSKRDLIGFGKYVANHLIAFPYLEEDKLILVISNESLLDFLSIRKKYQKSTYVSFDVSGKVDVNIARKEYDKYKDELTFDLLNKSLGALFIEFLDNYKKCESRKIIEKLNSV